jgi:hypothetical protein
MALAKRQYSMATMLTPERSPNLLLAMNMMAMMMTLEKALARRVYPKAMMMD